MDLQIETQAELFERGAELLTVDDDARLGRYSGVIVDRNRERRDQIIRCLAEGVGVNRVAKAFGASIQTVLAIRQRHAGLITAEKKDASLQIGRIVRLGLDRFEEALVKNEISPGQLPVAMGILLDKKAMLDGDATMVVRIEREEVPSVEDLTARLEAMKRVKTPLLDCDSGSSDETPK